ncbi:MAG: PAS domain S-box protein [Fibrobacter sp.]|nr:PAS domain S-box protein [Fibrobacter sp.]
MNPIVFLEIVGICSCLFSFFAICFVKTKRLPCDAWWLLFGLITVTLLHHCSNILEQFGITDIFDYSMVLLPFLWFFFPYSFFKTRYAEELKYKEENLSITFNSIGDAVITTDTRGNIVRMNPVAEKLTGWDINDAKGMELGKVFNIINANTRQPIANPVKRVLKSGNIVGLANHTLLIAKNGNEYQIADSAAPIKDTKGNTGGVVLVFKDVTKEYMMQEALQKTARLDSLAILSGGIAHDFNNLLGGIFGNIDMADELSDNPKVKRYLKRTLTTIDRARNLTSQLLTFAKGGVPDRKAGPILPFIRKAVDFALSGSNISCKYDVSDNLWYCIFDENQIGQVIDNLIINAQQAMPLGGTINVAVRNVLIPKNDHPILQEGMYVKISIRDSGIGISKDVLDRIFDPFFTTKEKGHGLGLATCYSIINRHEGHIEVQSEPGKGTTFHILLPATSKLKEKSVVNVLKEHKGKGTILVMDDEEVIRFILSDMLNSFGYNVITKSNGKEVLEYLSSELKTQTNLAAMIFDLTIPGGVGGKEIIEEIGKLDLYVPVFVTSGYSEDPIMANPQKYGFSASIRKPFRKSDLIKILNENMKD